MTTYEVLLQVVDRRIPGKLITFRHQRRQVFESLGQAERYARQLALNLNPEQTVYICDLDRKATVGVHRRLRSTL